MKRTGEFPVCHSLMVKFLEKTAQRHHLLGTHLDPFHIRQEQGEDVEEKEDEKPVESPKKTEKNEVNSVSCYKVGPFA